MGFKNMKRDDHGHVISNDETDGQKCQHQSGGNNKPENKPNENKASKLAKELGLSIKNEDDKKELALQLKSRGIAYDMSDAYNIIDEINSEAFDDDYDEEFEDDPAGHALDAVESELHINVLDSKEDLDDAKRWLVANGYAKSHMEAQDLIESALSDEGKAKLNKLLGFDEDDEFKDESQGLDKLGISQGFGKRVSKNQFEEYVKLSDEDKQKLRKQGFLQNYHGYDIEEVDGKDEYRIWKLGK